MLEFRTMSGAQLSVSQGVYLLSAKRKKQFIYFIFGFAFNDVLEFCFQCSVTISAGSVSVCVCVCVAEYSS